MSSILNKKSFGIWRYEILWVICFYFFFSYLYHLTLVFNVYGVDDRFSYSRLFNPIDFLEQSGLQYLLTLLLSLPIWWLLFRGFKKLSIKNRILVHLIILPFWIIIHQQLYYLVAEQIGFFHLRGSGQVWDLYIPALFYVLQFGLLHAYEYYHTNQKNLMQKAALSEAVLKSELSVLKAQLNPHFLYNVFNTINASVPPEQEQTREMVAKLADLFRYQLKATKKELVPIEDELEFVEKYLDLEMARFEDRLKVIIDVPSDIRKEMIPPMILQPLVENSIKHGLSSLIEGGEIFIRIRRDEKKIRFEVIDTGVGIKDKSKLFDVGVGLTNTKLRLEKMFNSKMIITDNIPRGLKIQFSI